MGKLKEYKSPGFYAAGLEVYFYRGHMVVGHDGCIPGFASRFFFLPDLKFGAVLMGNFDAAHQVVSTLANKLVDKVIGVPDGQTGENKKEREPELSQRNGRESVENPVSEIKSKKENKEKLARGKGQTESAHQLAEPQRTTLDAYTGDYWNPGYHTLIVEIRNGGLSIDATDRSMGFTLTFEHISNQTEYIAHLSDMYEGGDEPVEASFVFECDRATKLGLRLEWQSEEMIWFERV